VALDDPDAAPAPALHLRPGAREEGHLTVQHLHFGGRHSERISVVATAVVNGLGFTPYEVWALRRAERTAFAPTPFRCSTGAHATMAHLRTLPPTQAGADRMSALLSLAFASIAPSLKKVAGVGRLGSVLVLPERMDGVRMYAPDRAVAEQAFRRELSAHMTAAAPIVVPKGHAGLGSALLQAGAALVGSVDTYYDPRVVDELDRTGRLFDGTRRDAFIGGEGAALLLVTTYRASRSFGLEGLADIQTVSIADEPSTILNDVPCVAIGLTRAVRAVSERLVAEKRALDWWLTDLTAEHYRGHELQLAWPRGAHDVMGPGGSFEHLPQHTGDLGAATMGTGIAIAIEGMRRGSPRARTCIVTGTSQREDRAAVLIASDAARDGAS
jgi:3-oxoacyl-[acyl-carrier-protein] synthase-1